MAISGKDSGMATLLQIDGEVLPEGKKQI